MSCKTESGLGLWDQSRQETKRKSWLAMQITLLMNSSLICSITWMDFGWTNMCTKNQRFFSCLILPTMLCNAVVINCTQISFLYSCYCKLFVAYNSHIFSVIGTQSKVTLFHQSVFQMLAKLANNWSQNAGVRWSNKAIFNSPKIQNWPTSWSAECWCSIK